ncbi:2-oxoglutarate dehydrogenase E1 component [Deinococcus yavapaiensis]|uniref:oxoglutarate dehydrogenase (succinyl-transferring) n=1 Tax=Deinococcus yavapaiensis KR-236 TaxID=694435 RepID=A0A318SG98_9DEIO|nr:2-oxoglutarate dehydrogenase E1 component [Deinococcus yavapaiensis]PYE55916.1 2-oxoglutarate dehydrogenase E1 component [Deinococcus yavapaiensis KR-236]
MEDSQSVMYGGNASFVEGLYEDYLRDPTSVSSEWRSYFDTLRQGQQDTPHSPVRQAFLELGTDLTKRLGAGRGTTATPSSSSNHGVSALVNAYRLYGHLAASFNPLGLRGKPSVPELDPAYYGLSDAELDVEVHDGGFKGKLRDVLEELRVTYCGAIGFEFGYLPREEREWLQARVEEGRGRGRFSVEQKRRLLTKLNAAEGLERYLHVTYVGQKRFSLEGGESLIPMLDTIVQRAGSFGVKETVIGMAHRGRLNVLVNIFGKRPADLFAEFEGKKTLSDDPNIAGDVKYHMGFSSDVHTPGGPMHLALAFNPSHLEIVSPVVGGSTRARQDRRGGDRTQVLPITIHGDAAIVGQGVTFETVNLMNLRGFTTAGTIRIVVNNQVGFTTSDPRDARSSRYTTDVAKVVESPAMHVNSDDPEAVAFVAQLAVDYRQKFGKDVFIDLVCYRKLGHNESDDPTITQPVMYREVKAHPGTRALYAQRLEHEGVLQLGEGDKLVEGYRDLLDKGDTVVEEMEGEYKSSLATDWSKFRGQKLDQVVETGVPLNTLRELGVKLASVPEGFGVHRATERVLKARRDMAEGKQLLDWGMGEMLAYATLLSEGYGVRLTGQDAGRGTFVHRQAVVHDQNATDPLAEDYLGLANLSDSQGHVEIIDSTLSEEAVMAYEYGYSTSEPNALVLWEGQFGDFANGAQVVIDQFISSGESKWQRFSGLTLLLPHGYEGQGPEHSSARLERYLQLCAQNNMQVCVPSTPAQVFHMLRRQLVRDARKPLVVMTPKSLLRSKYATSPLEELASGHFREVIGDESAPKAKRVVISSGKLYWELFEAREKAGLGGEVALVRLEQLYPFPSNDLKAELARYLGAEVVWAQEEPYNMGAWLMIQDDLRAVLAKGQTLAVSSRPRSASPAVGYASRSNKEQEAVIAVALGLGVAKA